MTRPSFFLVGAPKSGTTSLHAYLGQHPGLFLCEPKEPHYFGEVRLPVMPVLDEAAYLALFDPARPGQRAGEASTGYLYARQAPAAIHAFAPEARIVAVLREPAARAYSHYWHNVLALQEELSFEDALAAEDERIAAGDPYRSHYVALGRYAEQLERYLERFEPSQVRVHLFEDLVADAPVVCRDLFEFLGVDPGQPVDAARRHNPSGAQRSHGLAHLVRDRAAWKAPLKLLLPASTRQRLKRWALRANRKPAPPMAPATRARLRALFAPEVDRLERLLDRDLSAWRER